MVVTEGEEFFPWEVLLRRHQLSLAIIPTIKQWELYYLGMSQSISSFYHFPELRPSCKWNPDVSPEGVCIQGKSDFWF